MSDNDLPGVSEKRKAADILTFVETLLADQPPECLGPHEPQQFMDYKGDLMRDWGYCRKCLRTLQRGGA